MSGGPVSFGDYTFPKTIQAFRDNFANAVPKRRRIPGISGAWSDDGDGPADTAAGNVNISFYLVTETRAEMDELRDAAMAMYDYGLAKLITQPTDLDADPRHCWARVNNISMPETKSGHTDLWQLVTCDFAVDFPRWEYGEYMPWTLGDGSKIGDAGLKIGGSALEIAASGTETDTTVTNDGNVTCVVAGISIIPGAGNSCQNPKVQRIKNGSVVDEVAYVGTLSGATDELYMSGKTRVATLNAVSVFGANFSYATPDFLRLASGSNTVRVVFANAGDAATVRLWYAHTWV